MALPDCEAVILAVPTPTMVTILPETVATDGLELVKITGFPEAPPVALSVNAASPNVLSGKAAKVIA
ncbi:hypothetical protein D3C86_767840 [compost metagenome]